MTPGVQDDPIERAERVRIFFLMFLVCGLLFMTDLLL